MPPEPRLSVRHSLGALPVETGRSHVQLALDRGDKPVVGVRRGGVDPLRQAQHQLEEVLVELPELRNQVRVCFEQAGAEQRDHRGLDDLRSAEV